MRATSFVKPVGSPYAPVIWTTSYSAAEHPAGIILRGSYPIPYVPGAAGRQEVGINMRQACGQHATPRAMWIKPSCGTQAGVLTGCRPAALPYRADSYTAGPLALLSKSNQGMILCLLQCLCIVFKMLSFAASI